MTHWIPVDTVQIVQPFDRETMKNTLCIATAIAAFSTPSVAETIGYQDWGDPTFGRGPQLTFSCFANLVIQCNPADGNCAMPAEIDPQYASIFAGEHRLAKNQNTLDYCVNGRVADCKDKSHFGLKIDRISVQERFYVGNIEFKRGQSHIQIEIPVQNVSEHIRYILSYVDNVAQKLVINYGKCDVSD